MTTPAHFGDLQYLFYGGGDDAQYNFLKAAAAAGINAAGILSVVAAAGATTAVAVAFTPGSGIVGTNLQTALVEVQGHIPTAASQLSYSAGGTIAATTVQTAIAEAAAEASQLATYTTKGDLKAATAASTVARLAVGSNGQALVADSTQTTGLKWGKPTMAGSDITNTPAGNVAATDVQAAITELDTEKIDKSALTAGTTGALLIKNNGGVPANFNPSGTDGFALTSDSSATQKVRWAAPTGGSFSTLSLPAWGASLTLDLSTATVFDVTLTGNTTLNFSNPSSGRASQVTVVVRQDGTGGRTLTWGMGTVTWLPDGVAPNVSLAANAVTMYSFMSNDAGATWLGICGAATVPKTIGMLAANPSIAIPGAGNVQVANLPRGYIVDPQGRPSFSLQSLSTRVRSGQTGASQVAIAVYSVVYSAANTFVATLVAKVAAAVTTATATMYRSDVLGPSAAAAPITLDFVNNNYMVMTGCNDATTLIDGSGVSSGSPGFFLSNVVAKSSASLWQSGGTYDGGGSAFTVAANNWPVTFSQADVNGTLNADVIRMWNATGKLLF